MSCGGDLYVVPGADPCAGGGGGGGVTSLQGITGAVNLTSTAGTVQYSVAGNNLNIDAPLFIGQYYRTSGEVLVSGVDTITFQAEQTWNNNPGYITWNTVGGQGNSFTVVQPGVYQVEFALSINANGCTWSAGRSANISVLRGTNQSLLQQNVNPLSGIGYSIQIVGTLRLNVGDVITCSHNGVNITGPGVIAVGLQNTFDYNTTFTWTYLKNI
jgi:hypothetical protein